MGVTWRGIWIKNLPYLQRSDTLCLSFPSSHCSRVRDTKLALVHDSAAVHVSKDFVPVTDAWLPAQALASGCPSSALCDRAAPSPAWGTIHACPHVKGTLALLPGVCPSLFYRPSLLPLPHALSETLGCCVSPDKGQHVVLHAL